MKFLGTSNTFVVPIAGTSIVQDTYRYIKAINANSTTSGAGGFDGMVAYTNAPPNSQGSNAVQCLSAIFAPIGSGSTAGGDFETALMAWLQGSTTATPAGVGLSSSTSPTFASVLSALRTSAPSQSF